VEGTEKCSKERNGIRDEKFRIIKREIGEFSGQLFFLSVFPF
jgi:hypothetical protein